MTLTFLLWSGTAVVPPEEVRRALLRGERPDGVRFIPRAVLEQRMDVTPLFEDCEVVPSGSGMRVFGDGWDLTLDDWTHGTLWLRTSPEAVPAAIDVMKELVPHFGLSVYESTAPRFIAAPAETPQRKRMLDLILVPPA